LLQKDNLRERIARVPRGEELARVAVDDEPPALEVLKKFITSVHTLELANTCVDAIEAMNFLQSNPVDLIFLDIKMPELLGTDFIRALKNPPKVIFTTAYRKYAIEGFELDAVDYLLKPISFDRFLKAVSKIMQTPLTKTKTEDEAQSNKQGSNGFMSFRSDRRMIKVALDDILYIESIKDYIKVITTTGTIITKQSISSVEETLPKDMFMRIHRSFIIRLDRITEIEENAVTIAGKSIPISRSNKEDLFRRLNLI
jgi:DNA-binding LytR/AlgR family response regulator